MTCSPYSESYQENTAQKWIFSILDIILNAIWYFKKKKKKTVMAVVIRCKQNDISFWLFYMEEI